MNQTPQTISNWKNKSKNNSNLCTSIQEKAKKSWP